MKLKQQIINNIPPSVEFSMRCFKALKDHYLPASPKTAATVTHKPCSAATSTELRKILENLNVHRGDVLMLHSSSKAMNQLGWTPTDMIDFLLEYLGPSGTLAMPSHPKLKEENGQKIYIPHRCPSGVGLATELFRRRKQTIRSLYPFSSAAAQGARAEELVGRHRHSFAPHDEKSPYAKLREMKGKVLALGCPLDRMTILHVAEDTMRDVLPIDNFYVKENVLIKTRNEEFTLETHRRAPWLWWYLAKYQWTKHMYRHGFVRETCVCGVSLREVDAAAAIEWMQQRVRKGKTIYPHAGLNRFFRFKTQPGRE